ncbi:MAG: hypothetical protein LPH20_11570 [Shewanella sp.]|nr:hypothetical protein [Shewanella sp.]
MENDNGVQLRAFPDEVLDRLREVSYEVIAEQSAKEPIPAKEPIDEKGS